MAHQPEREDRPKPSSGTAYHDKAAGRGLTRFESLMNTARLAGRITMPPAEFHENR
jgi:hypothetical protein